MRVRVPVRVARVRADGSAGIDGPTRSGRGSSSSRSAAAETAVLKAFAVDVAAAARRISAGIGSTATAQCSMVADHRHYTELSRRPRR